MKSSRLMTLLLIGALAPACATTTSSSTTWTAPPAAPAWSRHGRVAWVRENVIRQDGDPVGGALAGALIGGLIGGRGPAALFGAAGGAAVGAAASQGHAESRRYDVMVQFDDGYSQVFSFANASPFRPGEGVWMTPQGLSPG